MTTLATNPSAVTTAVSPEVVASLESQAEVLQTAVQNALHQHLSQNHGQLMTPQHLPTASQEIVQCYLAYLRQADAAELAASVSNLVAQGLGHLSALSLIDALSTTSRTILPEASPELAAVLHSYQHHFLYQYMQAREQNVIKAPENFYQTALERQISQERALREQIEAQSSQLARERALLTSLLDSIPDLIFYKDTDSVYLGCNDAFAQFAGRPEAELVGKTDLDMFPEETALFFREQDQEMLATGAARRNEEWGTYPDGRRVLLDTLKTPIYDAENKMMGLIGISRDITSVYESQQELRQLGYVVEQSLDGTAVADLDGFIQFVNPAWAAMHGYTADELIGQHLSIFHTEEQLANEVVPANQQVMESGQSQRGEIGHVRQDGSTFPTLMTIGLLRDNSGQPLGFVASAQDITEQKAAEQALRESENRYRQILDAITQLILVKGDKSRILWANKAFRDYYGMDNETLQGLIDAPFNEPDYTLQYVRDDAHVFDTGAVLDIPEEPVTRYDGAVGLFHTVKSPIFDENGRVIATVGVSEEITEQKAAEELRRQSEARLAEVTRIARLYSWEFDVASQMFTFQPDYYDLLGTTAEEEGGYALSAADYARKFVPPEEAAIVGAEIGGALTTTDPDYYREFDTFNVTQDGRIIPVRVRYRIVKDENGQTSKIIGANQDITEQKAAELALRESEERYRNILENANEIIYTLSLDGVFQYVSPAWTELLGHPIAEVEGGLFAAFVHEDDLPACISFLERIISTGESQRGVEYRVRHVDGSWRWHSSNGAAVKNAQGHVLYYVGMAQDITEKKASEAIMAKRARELQAVAEVGTAVSTTLDLETIMQRVVDLAKSRFKLYHTHIYLLDDNNRTLTLAAGAGEVGRQMVAQGWQISMNRENSLVARAARSREGEIANDVRSEIGFLPNPLLPDTRSELAAPIIVGDKLLGVWDVQAAIPDYFTDEDVLIQATLATQLGVAMQNARSFAQSETTRQELSQLTRRLTRQSWQEYLDRQEEKEVRVAIGQAPENGQPLSRSLVVQGETIGRLALAEPQALNEEAAEIMAAVAERLSSHIENLRLTAQTETALAQTEHQANRLSVLNEMGAALSRAGTLQEIYQIAALYTANILSGDMVTLALLEPSGDSFSIMGLHGKMPAEFPGGSFPLAGTSAERALREQRLLLAPQDFTEQPTIDVMMLAAQGIPSLIFAPLMSGERPLGVLNIGSEKANAYGPTDVSLVQQIVSLLSATLESRRLFEETRRRAEREALVNAISQKIQNAPTIQSAMQTAVTELGKALQVKRAVVQLNQTGPLPER
jgi:PAS domain S-box-containing protein